jgi:hypothetical protein
MKPSELLMPLPFPNPLVVRTAADVEAMRRSKHALRALILLRVSGLPVETSKQWEAKLNLALRECGCSLGAKSSIAAFVASLVWQSTFSLWSPSHWPFFLLRTFLLILLAGAAGKSIGILHARTEVKAIEKRIRNFEINCTSGGR